MGMRGIAAGLVVGLSFLLISPSCWAADGDVAEAAPLTETSATSLDVDHIRAEIEATRLTDPELAEEMAEQLELVESGQLSYEAITQEASRSTEGSATGSSLSGERLAGTGGEMMGTPFTGGFRGSSGETTRQGDPAYMTPELRAALQDVYDQVQGGTLSEGDARARAESILSEHGVTEAMREMGQGHEGEMTSPREAFGQWERSEEGQRTDAATREQYREMSERYQAEFEHGGGGFGGEREFGERAAERMSHEAHEAERFMSERDSSTTHEGSTREYDAPTREYEAVTHEYDAPTSSYEAPEQQQHEYQPPEQQYQQPY